MVSVKIQWCSCLLYHEAAPILTFNLPQWKEPEWWNRVVLSWKLCPLWICGKSWGHHSRNLSVQLGSDHTLSWICLLKLEEKTYSYTLLRGKMMLLKEERINSIKWWQKYINCPPVIQFESTDIFPPWKVPSFMCNGWNERLYL